MTDEEEPRRQGCAARIVRSAINSAIGLIVVAGVLLAWLEMGPVPLEPPGVQDVTELIAIDPERVVTPTTADEVAELLRNTNGIVSIGGGRFSMGGQVGTDDALFIDMRTMDDVLALDVVNKRALVEAGITWRKLIEAIDEHDLSVKIMQSYANFTVGGTLSVNAHGRYMGLGPVIHSVRSLELVLANGRKVRATREENPELFHAAIGGYGAIGVITAVELDLADNEPLKRGVARMSAPEFLPHFQSIEKDQDVVFFNADIYPPDYTELVAIDFSRTDEPVTIDDRLQAGGTSSKAERFMYWWVSEAPLGKAARSEVIDRMRLKSQPVVWRNYEASYDVAGLDPGSRKNKTYVLQEYFIPIERFETFLPKMRKVFQDNEVNVVNVSIRHAIADPDTYLTWAPKDCFAFVIYYKMGTSEKAWEETGDWTRAMADAILEEEGTWYLPYQIHATKEQFHAAYPRANAFFDLKKKVDPHYRFRNRLWDTYLPPSDTYGGDLDAHLASVRSTLEARETWKRPQDQTFLTLPEWTIVYSADETGAFLADHRPSEFPWFAAIGQFWTNYRAVWAVVRDRYSFNTGYHGMIWVIGASYTAEYASKGLYENTVGRIFESTSERTAEEDHYAKVTADYGAYTHHTPWYSFPFAERRGELSELPATGGTVRRWERWFASSVELTLKSWWSGAIGWATGTAYAPEATTIEAWIRPHGADPTEVEGVTVLEDLGQGDVLVSIPRYEPFTQTVIDFAAAGVEVVEVAGGDTIVVQVVAPTGTDLSQYGGTLVRWKLLTQPERERIALEIPMIELVHALPALADAGHTVEHLYDF